MASDGAPSDGSPRDGTLTDGAPGDGALGDGTLIDGAPGDGAPGDAGPRDATPPTDGAVGVDSGGCPPYQSPCNGVCIPTSNDPSNCGGCGIQCGVNGRPPNCSAGQCSSTCLAPLLACNGRCIDPLTSNDNCGGCGQRCGANQGCSNGLCVNAVSPTPPAGACVGGGPPTTIGADGGSACSGNVAQTTFRWAICSCTDVAISNPFMSDGYDSTQAPYVPGPTIAGRGCPNSGVAGQTGGGVGVNGALTTSAIMDVWGTTWTVGGIPLNGATVDSHQELHAGAQITGPTNAGNDAYVVGPLNGAGTFSANLYTPSCPAPGTYNVGGSCVPRAGLSVPPPCDCSPSQLIDVTGLVSARATNNDNATLTPPLDPNVFAAPGSSGRLDLPCGSYYLSSIAGGGAATTIVAHGNTALYIGGNVTAGSNLTFTLDPGATFDVFISGAICDSNLFNVGSPNYPANMRVYVGGLSTCNVPGVTTPIYSVFLDNPANIAGNVYAPYGQYFSGANILMYGAVFAKSFVNTNNTCIHYDRAVLNAGQNCPPPPPPVDAGSEAGTPDSGPPPPMCGSCRDCKNQACVNGSCGACATSADCCAPLTCASGQCILLR